MPKYFSRFQDRYEPRDLLQNHPKKTNNKSRPLNRLFSNAYVLAIPFPNFRDMGSHSAIKKPDFEALKKPYGTKICLIEV